MVPPPPLLLALLCWLLFLTCASPELRLRLLLCFSPPAAAPEDDWLFCPPEDPSPLVPSEEGISFLDLWVIGFWMATTELQARRWSV